MSRHLLLYAGLDRLFDKLKGSTTQKLQKRAIAMFIEEELQQTPWNATSNFYHYQRGASRAPRPHD